MGEHAVADNRLADAKSAYIENDPPIEVNQRWVCFNQEGEVFRRIRIMASHPDGDSQTGERMWIYVDEPAKMRRVNYGELRSCPEFNLRYVFTLEST